MSYEIIGLLTLESTGFIYLYRSSMVERCGINGNIKVGKVKRITNYLKAEIFLYLFLTVKKDI